MASTSDSSFGNTPIDAATVGSASAAGSPSASDIDPGVLADVKTILRDSLRLGPGSPMEDDMALVGGTIDLDSIDILLVVSNLEKHFKIKIPNEAVGRSAFTSVATLAKYVSDNRELLKVLPPVPGSAAPQTPGDYLARLPHGPEFRYVSAVTDVAPGKAAAGYWNVTGSEPFFAGHFPGRPLVPGVLITEALAQIAGIASVEPTSGADGIAVLAAVEVRFFAPVVPPATIELRAERSGGEGPFVRCAVTASVGGRAVAGGSVELKLGGVGVVPVAG